MKIVADQSIQGLEYYFKSYGDVRTLPDYAINANSVKEADCLLVRSTVSVNAELLAATNVRFVGSCTIGTDHLDLPFFKQAGIAWGHAPGCNAQAVSEYVLQGVIAWCLVENRNLEGLRVGVIGYGHVGRQVVEKLTLFGAECYIYDPLLRVRAAANKENILKAVQFVSFEEALQTDVISLHVPLVLNGPYPTKHLIGVRAFEVMQANSLLINTSRGAVLDEQAYYQAVHVGMAPKIIADVFVGEPDINPKMIEYCFSATPHIAGHSYIGKERGTQQVFDVFVKHFGYECAHFEGLDSRLKLPTKEFLLMSQYLDIERLYGLLDQVTRLQECAQSFKQCFMHPVQPGTDSREYFQVCRREYVPRYECSQCRVLAPNLDDKAILKLRNLGFQWTA